MSAEACLGVTAAWSGAVGALLLIMLLVRLFSQERAVIVCSCNVLSDAQVRSAITSAAPRPRMSYVYASLGCAAECGRCAQTIKVILEEIRRLGTNESLAIEAA
jgi:bacterioferritin-associated ferredoxin